MKIATGVFVSSMTFGAVVALVYWFTTKELVGTVLLGLFAVGFAFVAAYLQFTRGHTHVDGDDTERTPRELAGEKIGVFSLESPWPVILALCSTGLVIGIVLHPMLAALSALAFFSTLWQLVRESV
ncbi:MAG: cytochrome c oxidase subunit 4 [Candidatus Velthaea sp.]